MRQQWKLIVPMITTVFLVACGGGGADEAQGGGVVPNPPEQPPVAQFVYSPETVITNQVVTLDGSGSISEANRELGYQWTLVKQPGNSFLNGEKEVIATFVPIVVGEYVIGLTVHDGLANSDREEKIITVVDGNIAPVANAGPPQNVATGTRVMLDGSSSTDVNNDRLTYRWSLSRPTGSAAELDNSAAVRPAFVVDSAGEYVASLIVNDGKLDSVVAMVSITAYVENVPPVANAGTAQSVTTGTLVRLDGTGSTDANGDPLTYKWSLAKPSGSSADLNNHQDARPTFTPDIPGKYIASLVVNDGKVESTSVSAEVTVTRSNAAPVASAGRAIEQEIDTVVILDGSASTDADGDSLQFAWTLTTPAGSQAKLSDATAVKPSFNADAVGDYVAQLQVTDTYGALSAKDQVNIRIVRGNVAPVAHAGINQQGKVGSMITLDGSQSSDRDGDPLTYQWSLVSVPYLSQVALLNATVESTKFTPDQPGTYVVELVVNDGRADSLPSRVVVTVDPVNAAPTANAGSATTILVGSNVLLDGRASTDAEGEKLNYRWTLSGPGKSVAVLLEADTATPSFLADVAGDYVATLIVNDGEQDSEPAQVVIKAAKGLKLYSSSGESSLPYYAQTSRSSVSIGGSNVMDIDRFRLQAEIGTYTIVNVSATTNMNAQLINPRFDGLYEGLVITPGNVAEFTLRSNKTNGQTVEMTYRFTIKETGETFIYTGNFNFR